MSDSFIGKFKVENEVIDNVLKFFNKNKKRHKAGIVGGKQELALETKDSTDIPLTTEDLALNKDIRSYLEELSFCVNKYKKKYVFADQQQSKWGLGGCNIQMYKPGQGFKLWHYENDGSPDAVKRHLVFMTFLNTCKNAGTMFYYQKKTFDCKKGDTLIWPAAWTHTHKGEISEKQKENKYIITGWFYYD
jgi:prolyl 4-hydroxylase